MENKDLFELMTKVYNEMQIGFKDVKADIFSLTQDVSTLKQDVSTLKQDVSKNSILLEKLNTKIETLAEVQQSFQEQLDRSKSEDGTTLGERLEIIELAVTKTSDSVNDLIDTVDVIKDSTASHDMDIKILKKIQRRHSM